MAGDRYLPSDEIISIAGTPNANGKHESLPKHFTSLRKIGVKNVDVTDPALIEK